MRRRFRAAVRCAWPALIVVQLLLTPGCAFFFPKPALPKRGTIEAAAAPAPGDDFSGYVARADVLYFPSERLGGGGAEACARLLENFRREGVRFTVAWDLIDAEQQPLLDEISAAESGRERLIERLRLNGTARDRQHCRQLLRDAPGIRYLALRFPDRVLEKLRIVNYSGAAENAELPQGFTVAPNDFELFTEQLPSVRALPERDLRGLYQAYLATEQFAADRIVDHLREAQGTKLLVFLHRRHLDPARGVPQFVAQKIKTRQVVVEPAGTDRTGADLITSGNGGRRRARLGEVVDNAPAPFRDWH